MVEYFFEGLNEICERISFKGRRIHIFTVTCLKNIKKVTRSFSVTSMYSISKSKTFIDSSDFIPMHAMHRCWLQHVFLGEKIRNQPILLKVPIVAIFMLHKQHKVNGKIILNLKPTIFWKTNWKLCDFANLLQC